MNWTFDSDIDEFLHKNEAAILGSESENCILLDLLNAVRQGRLEQDELVYCTGTLEGSRRPCAVLWKGKQKILLTAMDAETAEHLADALLPLGHSLREARGSVVTCRAFAHRWSTLRERTTTEVMRQGIYELNTVTRPDLAGGQLVTADGSHLDVAGRHFHEFHVACFPDHAIPIERQRESAGRMIERQRLHFWRDADGTLVSMAAMVRETQNTASISAVYTPTEYRGQGHAARVVGYLSQKLLDEGKRACNLFTDMTNPTSNGVYVRLGYRKLGEQAIIRFEGPIASHGINGGDKV